jgi:hypothetical protein
VRIDFEVAGNPVQFRRNNFFGNTTLVAAGRTTTIESAFSAAAQFSLALTRAWTAKLFDSVVIIEKTRPRAFPYLRRNHYRVIVDGRCVAERYGY